MTKSKSSSYYLGLMNNCDLPESVIELVAFYVKDNGSDSIVSLAKTKGNMIYRMNETFMFNHNEHEKFGEVIEICNPWARHEFAFIALSDFEVLIKNLLAGYASNKVTSLSLDEKDRMDFKESSEENW
jgi:hypothetical protein